MDFVFDKSERKFVKTESLAIRGISEIKKSSLLVHMGSATTLAGRRVERSFLNSPPADLNNESMHTVLNNAKEGVGGVGRGWGRERVC
jgi:hypothetical protein